jgi:hypothetical protein
VGTEQEEQIARWFVGIVDEAIARGGWRAATAIWFVLDRDRHADPYEQRAARCPALDEVPDPPVAFEYLPGDPNEPTPEPDEVAAFLDKLRTAAPSYVYTAIAGASAAHLRALQQIMRANDDELEAYRPFGLDLRELASMWLQDAHSILTRRQLSNAEACRGVANWADGCASVAAEHAIPPVFRIGAVAWLARVALRSEPSDGASSNRASEATR